MSAQILETQPRAIRLVDYAPPDYTTDEVRLEFDISDEVTRVTSTLSVRRLREAASELLLFGEDQTLVSLKLDGRSLSSNEYALDDETLRIPGLGESHEVEVVSEIYPQKNTALEGLYKSSAMYCTQCEAEGFRKITYYQDRPDVLAKFTTTITADAERYPTLLSNGNLVSRTRLEDGRLQAVWQDPFKKPSYLFALVAGNLALLEDTFTTLSGRKVDLMIYSEPHNIDQCGYAMDVLKRSMRWDEQRFGREYDLDIFMIVAVEDFNMGAMENKGLNIFNTSCVLATADTATDEAFQRVEAVVAHEYFHNWSGNRVTCRDWFQLSLKEGFTVFRDAEFSSDMNSRAVKRIEDVSFLRAVQFAEDASPLAHPVRPASYLEISNFYTTTIYEKGAEVVAMYRSLLGDEAFRHATDLYFERHDGTAATTDDFAAAMAEVGQIDLDQFKRWYTQAGTPTLSVAEHFDQSVLQITVTQRGASLAGQPEALPYHMPLSVGLIDQQGQPLSWSDLEFFTAFGECQIRDQGETLMLGIRQEKTELIVRGLSTKPVVSFLRGFSAPVLVEYPRSDEEHGFLVMHDKDGFVRWDSLQTLWLKLFDAAQENPTTDPVAVLGQLARSISEWDNSEQLMLAATMLSVPAENYLFEQLKGFDVDQLLDVRDGALSRVATEHGALWAELVDRCESGQGYTSDALGMARRALGNVAFGYWSKTLDGVALEDALMARYRAADNLTDRRAVLSIASRSQVLSAEFRRSLFAEFYETWQDHALVVDLWFNLQAQSPQIDIDGLQALVVHPAFDQRNPNRARSVYGAFGMLNNRRFHALDGSGYEFLGQAVAVIDGLNPQLAARLATPLTRLGRYDLTRQRLMRNQLQLLSDRPSLSKDLYEIVTKSLA